MEKTWNRVINPMQTATDHSYKKGLDISKYHLGQLNAGKSNPAIDVLYLIYKDVHDNYQAGYDQWVSNEGLRQGDTLNLGQLLTLLSGTKIRKWDIAIQSVYDVTTPRYKALLPNHRTPFQSGGSLVRISSVNALSLAIGSDAALATLKTEINAFYLLLNAAANEQQTAHGSTDSASLDVEALRIIMCKTQFSNLCTLIIDNIDNPASVQHYFDLENINKQPQVVYTHLMAGAETRFVVKHTFHAGDMIRLFNKGNTSLTFFLTNIKAGVPTVTVKTVAPLTDITVAIEQLGDLSNHFLKVTNNSPDTEGEFEIDINA